MDKNEILEKSRKENQGLDERDQQIQLKAYANAHRAILFVCAALSLLLYYKGHPFAECTPFLVIIFVSGAALDLTQYRYYRKPIQLIQGIFGLAIVLLYFTWMLDFF